MPASFGVHGPGDTIRCVGRFCGDLVERDLIVAMHLELERRIDLAQPLHEVVGERIVVVDQQDHRVRRRRRKQMESNSCGRTSTATEPTTQRVRDVTTLGGRFTDANRSSGSFIATTRKPNLSPTFTASPAPISWPLTSSSSSCSHDLSNCRDRAGPDLDDLRDRLLLRANVTTTGTLIRNKLRAYGGSDSSDRPPGGRRRHARRRRRSPTAGASAICDGSGSGVGVNSCVAGESCRSETEAATLVRSSTVCGGRLCPDPEILGNSAPPAAG